MMLDYEPKSKQACNKLNISKNISVKCLQKGSIHYLFHIADHGGNPKFFSKFDSGPNE